MPNMKMKAAYFGGQLAPTPEDIPEPSHSRVFCEKFRSVYVVKGVWNLLTDLLLNRHNEPVSKCVSLGFIYLL